LEWQKNSYCNINLLTKQLIKFLFYLNNKISSNVFKLDFIYFLICTLLGISAILLSNWSLYILPIIVVVILSSIYGEKFIKNRPAAVSFMKGYIRSCRYYYDNALLKKDPKAYQEILNIISKYSGEKPEQIALSLPYNVQNGEIDADEIQQQLDWWHKHNLVSKKLSRSEVVDLSFWKEALAQIGQ